VTVFLIGVYYGKSHFRLSVHTDLNNFMDLPKCWIEQPWLCV